nr:MAG TPA: hypothetical protein [Bacteriophage sp.]DAK51263.1 MAG TPA: hypothetical protein [Caudoviricetes sp.]DAM03040.1 MAG TPA: hypothetical protein [Bacteriophage sp.]DAM40149.1 MAG TPA: hypothetical protein [Caudoviricetes sp.]DAQ57283.1 MAG TPA: hypothetical protein [Bacteriophage sp.]
MVRVKLICPLIFVAYKKYRMRHHVKIKQPLECWETLRAISPIFI